MDFLRHLFDFLIHGTPFAKDLHMATQIIKPNSSRTHNHHALVRRTVHSLQYTHIKHINTDLLNPI